MSDEVLCGVDVGGTFTDAVVFAAGRLYSAKSPTTQADQSVGVLQALTAALDQAGLTSADVDVFCHGMTVATNALLEGNAAKTVFCATSGFTDLIELARQDRPDLYRLSQHRPQPLTPPSLRVPVPERTGPQGPIEPLTVQAAAQVAELVAAQRPEAVAVCLLHADRYPEHELLLGRMLRERLPDDVHISLSHQVTGTFREYERAATTEIDAGLSPLLARYLDRLATRAQADGLPAPLIMQSSGGLTSIAAAQAHAALTVLSGPAGGAAAAALLAHTLAQPNLLCFDLGGTSCDVCVVSDGRVAERGSHPPTEIGGRPLALPTVDIATVGAGGGSIAWADPGGALRVGPQSAGARPGPACYGHGGSEPTVTDAHLVLGNLDPELPLAGELKLDLAAAERAVATLARKLGLPDVRTCAEGILTIANAEMIRALRVVSIERGLDPRDFALLAFGGAGPLHACAIAHELGIERIVVPRTASVLSALGLAAADRRQTEAKTVLLSGEQLTDAALAAAAGSYDEVVWEARYAGQSHELALHDVAPTVAAVRAALAAEHRRRYGFTADDDAVEVVTVRRSERTPGPTLHWAEGEPPPQLPTTAGGRIVLPGATLLVAPGWRATVHPTGTIILDYQTNRQPTTDRR